ncbi:MAG: hypothetical protein AAGD96_08885 [Chloroflexota bacterium]
MKHKFFKFTHAPGSYSPFVATLMFVVIAAILMMSALSRSATAQTGSTLRIDPANISNEVNETLDFALVIDVDSSSNYGNGSFTITYDSTILRLDNFAVGTGLFGAVNTDSAGIIRFNALSVTGETGTVTLGSGQFTAIGEGDIALTIGIVDPPGDTSGAALPNVSTVNGSVSIDDPANSPTETPTNTLVPTETSTNTPVATETPANTPVATETSTNTPVATETPVNTPVATATSTNTPVATETPVNTPVATATSTNTPAATPTSLNTPVATETPLGTPESTETPTKTPIVTETPVNTPVTTETPISTPAETATPGNTPVATGTPSTPISTQIPGGTPTNTPVALTSTPASTEVVPTATMTVTPESTVISTPTITSTPISPPSGNLDQFLFLPIIVRN